MAVDLLDSMVSEKDIPTIKCDTVVHSAATMPTAGNKVDFFENVVMTSNLSKLLERNPPKQIIFIGSIDIYELRSGPIDENSPVNPSTKYGLSKWLSEEWLRVWCKQNQVLFKSLRLTHVYGPNDNGRKFIANAVRSIQNNKPIELYGDGLDLRDFIYSEDLGSVLHAAIKPTTGFSINVASGKSVTMLDLIECLEEITGGKIEVVQRERAKPKIDYQIDTTKMNKLLSLGEFTPINEGLSKIMYP
jgi:UDP-glucose 4-epimerase